MNVLRLARTPTEELRIERSEYEGHPFVNVRVWVFNGTVWLPTKKGCSFRFRELDAIAEYLCQLAAEEQGTTLATVHTLPSKGTPR